MIRINKYKVCRITGETDIEATLLSPAEQVVERRFVNEQEAIDWIEDEQASELSIQVMNWIHHKQHIAAHSDWYRTPDRKRAMEMVSVLANEVIKYRLHSACVEVLNVKAYLYQILPAPGNSSFETSRIKLDEIIAFCDRKMKRMQLKKIS